MARNREFDEELVIARSIAQFWERGYHATSMADIARVTSVGNGSLYAAYGSKAGLFVLVFARYCEDRVAIARRAMNEGASPLDAVGEFFDAVVADCLSHQPSWGCLMLNSMVEVGRTWPEVAELARGCIAGMESVVAARMERDGVASGADAAWIAVQVVHAAQALIQASLLEADAARLAGLAAASRAQFAGILASAG